MLTAEQRAQVQEGIIPSPRELFKVASGIAFGGVKSGKALYYYEKTFIGTYRDGRRKHHLSIEHHTDSGRGSVRIVSDQFRISVHDYRNERRFSSDPNDEFSVSGQIPPNILEILGRLTPDKRAMDEVYRGHSKSMNALERRRRRAVRALGGAPFWRAERILDRMDPQDAERYVNNTRRGRSLPPWVRERFSKK